MNSPLRAPRFSRLLMVAAAVAVVPGIAHAQTGKWVGTVKLNNSGSADLTIEPRSEKQSKAKMNIRNGRRESRMAWDIVQGRCRDEGVPIAPQAQFTALQTQMDGSVTVTANVPKLESGKLYYFRVFDPQTQASDVTSFGCSNISEVPPS
ncbi:MAG: hypothetical protein ABI120_04775 [Gemmatimonadaceae bacterium]